MLSFFPDVKVDFVGVRGGGGHRRTWPTETTKRRYHGLIEIEATITEPVRVGASSSTYAL